MVTRTWPIWLATSAVAIGLASAAAAGGFREQGSWQFRNPAEASVKQNKEASRLQSNGLDLPGSRTMAGYSGSSGAAPATGVLAGGSTIGNSTSGTTNYTVNLHGNDNEVTIDGYLNLDTNQTNENQTAEVNTNVE